MKTTDIKSLNKNPTDPRLRSEKFRQDVRLVFDYLDIENTHRNFKKWDKIFNWTAMAHNFMYPAQTARVLPIWNGHPISNTITIALPGRTQDDAIKNLDTDKYVFHSWSW